MSQSTLNAVAAVSEARQWDRLMQMAAIGAIPGNGVNRAWLTEADGHGLACPGRPSHRLCGMVGRHKACPRALVPEAGHD